MLLTTWYPPLQGIAVQRMLAFAKYLDHKKFRLTIITLGDQKTFGLSEDEYATVFRIKSKGKFLNPEFRSSDSKWWHYTKVAWKKIRMKLQGDELYFYFSEATSFLKSLHQNDPVDLIISSFSPAAPHLAALSFCKEYRVKWIVDMRDEMSLNPQSDLSVRKYYASIEKEIAGYATALTSVSQPIVDYFKTVIPGLKAYVEIRNGFDHEINQDDYNFNETFTILHAGSFYGTRKPDTLLKALQDLKEAGLLPERWKFICAGAVKNFSIPDSIKSHVEIIERVSHEKSLSMMRNADLNVLIQPPTGRKGVYTGKIFEYISVAKPVLAIVDETDVAAELINDLEVGFVAAFTDIEAIKASLVRIIGMWKNREHLNVNPDSLIKLHRKYQIQKLNLLIENILNEK